MVHRLSAVRERAPAKVNLLLRLVGRRPDGYHELVSIFHALDLADGLTARLLPAGAPPGCLEVRVEGPAAAALEQAGVPRVERVGLDVTGVHPTGSANLVVRAAEALWSWRIARGGAGPALPPATSVVIDKQVPVQAGLGGGSSDAAAALRALNRLWGVGASEEALEALGAQVGADVPFCVRGGVQLARGIGERLTRLPSRLQAWYVLVVPASRLATVEVFRLYDELRGRAGTGLPGGAWRQAAAEREAAQMAQALAAGSLTGVAARMGNDLTRAATRLLPVVEGLVQVLRAAGLPGAVMTGSGPAVVGVAPDEGRAREGARAALAYLRSARLGGEAFVAPLGSGGV